MREDAQQAAVEGVAGAAASAMTLNYSGCSLTNNAVTVNKCVQINNCSQVGSILQGGLPSGYSVASVALAANGETATCTVTGQNSKVANFTGIGAGI
jgi:MSHA pilin protein MshA